MWTKPGGYHTKCFNTPVFPRLKKPGLKSSKELCSAGNISFKVKLKAVVFNSEGDFYQTEKILTHLHTSVKHEVIEKKTNFGVHYIVFLS